MTSPTKTCINCGTVVDSEMNICPKCGGSVFQSNRTNNLGWSPDNEEDTLRLISFPTKEEPKQEPPTPKKKTKRVFILKKMYKNYLKKKKKKSKEVTDTQNIPHSSDISSTKSKFQSLPDLTKKLILTLIALLAICVFVLCIALYKHKPNKTRATPTPSVMPTPTSATQTANADGTPIGKLKINDNNVINIRVSPSTDAAVIGITDPANEYDVYAIEQKDQYTWYQLGPEAWIADGGGWTSFTSN